MKLKLKLDKASIVDFFSTHAEKVVFGGVVLGALALMVPMGDGAFDKTPDDLVGVVGSARANIESASAPEVTTSGKYLDLVNMLLSTPVAMEPYEWDLYLNDRVFEGRKPRGMPPLLAMKDLRTAIGRSRVLMSRAAGGGQTVKGARWVCLTGLVPIGEQTRAFAKYFAKVMEVPGGAELETPTYLGFEVVRAEQGGPSKSIWFVPSYIERVKSNWNTPGEEIVDPVYVNEGLTHPLPPLFNKAIFDERVAHEPEIPLRGDLRGRPEPTPEDTPLTANTPAGGNNEFPLFAPRVNPTAEQPQETLTATDDTQPEEPTQDYLLLRFFDFEVQPGKQYAYQIKRIAMGNPNSGVEERFLEDPALAAQNAIFTPGSEWSPAVLVPRDTSVLAGPVTPATRSAEARAKMKVVKWDVNTAEDVKTEVTVERGGVANRSPGFVSDAIAVDMRGGEKISGRSDRLTQPAEVLVLDVDGNLFVREELADAADYQDETETSDGSVGGGDGGIFGEEEDNSGLGVLGE